MGRRTYLISIAVLLAGIALIVWLILRNSRNIVADPYAYIKPDAYILFESANLPGLLNSVTTDIGLFKELGEVKELTSAWNSVRSFRDYMNREEISSLVETGRTVISFHPSGGGRVVPQLSAGLPAHAGYNQVIKAIREMAGDKFLEIKAGGERFYGFSYNSGGRSDTVFITFREGILLAGISSGFIGSVTGISREETVLGQPGLARIMNASGKKEDKMFVLMKNFPGLISKIVDPLTGSDLVSDFSRLASAAEGDIYINEKSITFSGYAESTDSTDILFRFKDKPAAEFNSAEALPSSVVLYETVVIDRGKIRAKTTEGAADQAVTPAGELLPFAGDELTRAIISLKGDSDKLGTFCMLELENRDMAEQILTERLAGWAEGKNISVKDLVIRYQPDDQVTIPVYTTPWIDIADAIIPGFSSSRNDSLIAFTGNFMITGNSYEVITRVLYENILNKTLANDIEYRDFENNMPSVAGYFFYCVPGEITGYLSEWLSENILSLLRSNSRIIKKIPAVGFRFSASNDMIYNTLFIKYGKEVREESGAEWETLLDAEAVTKPFFFTNHNTGAREIFIQDSGNNAYLINSAGRILWKIMLNERISGPVFMIDYYRNGKNQILFAGREWLHLIDRNGNYVERFPVRLRSPASAPPALFDYDGNREYRILIPGEDRNIYAYDKSGNVVKGWKLFQAGSAIRTEIRFFRISGKDYLVAADETGIYLLDRTGNIRTRLKQPVARAVNSEIRLETGSKPSLVFTSPDGSVQLVSFDGNVRKFELGRFNVDHSFDFFDVDGDGFGEYIFIDRGIVYLYDDDRSPVFTKDFNTGGLEGPISFVFSPSDRRIGVFDSFRKQIYLLDKRGNVMDGFPRRGASVFSIGKLSEKGGFNLIVGGDDNFLYNYKLNTDF